MFNVSAIPSLAAITLALLLPLTAQAQSGGSAAGGGAARAESGLSEEAIRKDCTMAAAPDDCRVRARQGLTDDSIERDLP